MATTISISGLVKSFGPTGALDGLDLQVRTGEVHGFLGPNGAGKTTTLRILLDLLGRLRGGLDPKRRAAFRRRDLAGGA
jgi:ABC-2 type transport system ATP-binding protein